MHAHAQNVSVSYPFTLSQTNQIPFLFSAIPYQLIDDEVFGDLKGSHVKLILAIDRFRNLKLKQHKSDQVLLSGWTIAISQQVLAAMKFNQGASASPVTPHNASYGDDVRELTEYWCLHKKARGYGSHHQYRLHNFKGCVNALVADYNLNRQQAVDVLKVCIQLHVDTPDTPNWYIKHHQGLEYLNMAIAQVTLYG